MALLPKEKIKHMVSSESSASNREALLVCGRIENKSNTSEYRQEFEGL
jgi:hypothetical protein